MRKILLSLLSICSVYTALSQERKMEVSSYKTKSGETIVDTIWKIRKYESKINQSTNEVSLDTVWTIDEQTYHKRDFLNPVLPATKKGNVSIGATFANNGEDPLGFPGIRIGYFTQNNVMLSSGLAAAYSIDAKDLINLNLMLSARKYFGKGISSKTFVETGLSADIVGEQFMFGAGIGKTFFIGNNFGIDIGVGYRTIDFKTKGDIVIGFGFQGIISR
jgi:hypothetical protein